MIASLLLRAAPRAVVPAATGVRSFHVAPALSAIKIHYPNLKLPTVDDISVNITFVNPSGERTTLRGRAGQRLTDVAVEHGYKYLASPCGAGAGTYQKKHNKEWVEDQYGEGASCSFCHVVLSPEMAAIANDMLGDESHMLSELDWNKETPRSSTSRLGCQVFLKKEMDGMVVHCPDNGEYYIP